MKIKLKELDPSCLSHKNLSEWTRTIGARIVLKRPFERRKDWLLVDVVWEHHYQSYTAVLEPYNTRGKKKYDIIQVSISVGKLLKLGPEAIYYDY